MKRNATGAGAVACRPSSHGGPVTLQITPCGATGRRERTERCGRCAVACVHRQEGSGIVLREALARRVVDMCRLIREHKVHACKAGGNGSVKANKPTAEVVEVDTGLRDFVSLVGAQSPEQVGTWLFAPHNRDTMTKIADNIGAKIGGNRPAVRLVGDGSAKGHVRVLAAEFDRAFSQDLKKVH